MNPHITYSVADGNLRLNQETLNWEILDEGDWVVAPLTELSFTVSDGTKGFLGVGDYLVDLEGKLFKRTNDHLEPVMCVICGNQITTTMTDIIDGHKLGICKCTLTNN